MCLPALREARAGSVQMAVRACEVGGGGGVWEEACARELSSSCSKRRVTLPESSQVGVAAIVARETEGAMGPWPTPPCK
eukprot:scaffold287883_cov18-Tisochrysis_lutea.AAC.1